MNLKQMSLFCFGTLGALSVKSEAVDSTKVYQVDEVTVQASRMERKLKNIPQKVEIISSDLIKSIPSENLAEVLKRTTNLDIIQYPGLSASIGMRGFSPSAHSRSYTLLLINGKPAGTTNLAAVSLDNVEQIEVIKGSYSVLYGSDAMGGVINIITKQATNTPEASVSVESGSFGNRKLSGNFSGNMNDKLSFRLGYSHMEQQKDYRIGNHNLLKMTETEKLILDKASYGDEMDNSAYELNTINANLSYSINKLWKASIDGTHTFANDVETPGNYWGSYGESKKDINRTNIYMNLERNNANNHLCFNPYFTKELDPNYSDNTDTGYLNFKSDIQEYGFQFQDQQTYGKLKVLAGADYKVYDYSSERWESSGTPTDPYKPNNRNLNAALFTQLAYSTDNLDLNAGIRYDHFTYEIDANAALNSEKADAHYNTVNPSVGLKYHFLENFNAHSSFGTSFSIPDAYKVAGSYSVSVYFADWDYTWTSKYIGNPDLKPEKAKTIDMGLGYNQENVGFKTDLTYFHTTHNNKIVSELLESGEYTYINANEATMDGLELMSSFNIGSFFENKFKLEFYANWTWMLRNDFEDTTTSKTVTKDMLYTHKSNGNFGISYGQKSISMRLNARYMGSRLETDSFNSLRPDITSADYYTSGGYSASDLVLKHPNCLLFDYSVNYAYNKHVNFGITASNLMDENYSEKDGYNMPGRSIVVKLAYAF